MNNDTRKYNLIQTMAVCFAVIAITGFIVIVFNAAFVAVFGGA